MKVYVVVSMDKAEHVLNDCSVYENREDAVSEMEKILPEINYPTCGYETLDDGTESLCLLWCDDWEVQLFEREIL